MARATILAVLLFVDAERAQGWLDGRPESGDPKFFSCVGCHAR
jgi:hypothetical protein